jgi:hypothetical protein
MQIPHTELAAAMSFAQPDNIAPLVATHKKLQEEEAKVTAEDRVKSLQRMYSDPQYAQELSAERVYKIQSDALAQAFALGFFKTETLGKGDWPTFKIRNRDKYYNIYYLGQDGGHPKKQRVIRQTFDSVLMIQLTTPEVDWEWRSLQVGDWDEYQRVNSELRYELNLKLDVNATSMLDNGVVASGLRSRLNLHSSIVAANIPDKNYYDLSGEPVAGKLSVEKLKQIIDYAVRYTSDVEIDGPLQIGSIFCSSTNLRDLFDMVDLVSIVSGTGINDPVDTIPVSARNQIFQSGTLNKFFGHPINLVACNRIESGKLYVSTNKPAGILFHKPEYDGFIYDNTPAMHRQNKESLVISTVVQFYMPEPWTYRYMKVQL